MAKPKYWDGTEYQEMGASANKVTINDAGGLINATEVEGALQELAAGKLPYASIAGGDFNSMVTPGIYTMRPSVANAPTGGTLGYWGLIVLKSDLGGEIQQIATMESTTNIYNRHGVSGSWSAWVKQSVDTDYVRQPGYGTTGGSANAYTLTLSPALEYYAAGVCVAVKIHIANTGASTININGLGAKAILDSKGNAMTSGKLRLNGVYTLRYDGSSFILQGEGGDYGTAGAAQVLAGYTVGTDSGLVSGTISSKSAQTYNPSTSAQTIAAGQYLSGVQTISAVGGTATDADVKAGKIYSSAAGINRTGTNNKIYAPGETVAVIGNQVTKLWEKTGSGDTIASGINGNIFYGRDAGGGNETLFKCDVNGNKVWSKTNLYSVKGIHVDGSENVYAAHASGVSKYDSSGNQLSYTAPFSGSYRDVHIDSEGNGILACANGSLRIVKTNNAGSHIWSKSGSDNGNAVTTDSNNDVFHVSESYGIGLTKYSKAGVILWTKANMTNFHPECILTDSSNNLYFAATNTLYKYNSGGTVVWTKTSNSKAESINYFISVAQDQFGNIFLAYLIQDSPQRIYLAKLNSNGTFLFDTLCEGVTGGANAIAYDLSTISLLMVTPLTLLKYDLKTTGIII